MYWGTILRKPLALAAVAPLAFAAGAQPADLKATLAKDTERWSAVEAVTANYRAAPVDWIVLDDAALPYKVSFPCQPVKTVVPAGKAMVPTFSCVVHQRAYTLQVYFKPMNSPLHTQAFFAGMEFGLMESATRSGAQPELIPVKKVVYQDFTGRDLTVANSKIAINARNLSSSNIQIALNAGGAKQDFAKDEAFFNSLKAR